MKPNGFANFAATAALASLLFLAGHAVAAPVTYSFSTQASPVFFGLGGVPGDAFDGGVYGTFVYDAQASRVAVNPDGSFLYASSFPLSVTAISSFSATVGGFNFTDTAGTLQVGNNTFGTTASDVLQFSLEPPLTNPAPHNLTRFSIGNFTLANLRMFWIQGQQTPDLIPDYLSDQAMPASLPSFTGRLSLDFYFTPDPSAPLFFVAFDGLQVTPSVAAIPEPETYAMLLAGLGLLGFEARRRKRLAA